MKPCGLIVSFNRGNRKVWKRNPTQNHLRPHCINDGADSTDSAAAPKILPKSASPSAHLLFEKPKIAVINLFHIRRLTGSLPPIGKTVCRPLAATIGMSAAIFIVQRVLNGALSAAPGTMPDKLITLACIGVAVAVYAVLLLALGAVERDDVLLLPKGEKIADILHLK